jgi:transposase
MCRRPEQKGARKASARTLAWRLHHEDPRKIGRLRGHHRLRPDRRRSLRRRHFETLLEIGPDIQPRAVICDKGYASKANRDAARKRRIAPVIPHKANERDKPAFFARTLYRARARIEQGVGRLKRFKRVALRCEKTERNFRSIVSFAAGLCLIKFVHTA